MLPLSLVVFWLVWLGWPLSTSSAKREKGNVSAVTYPPVGAVVPDAPAKAKTAIQQRKNPKENRLGKKCPGGFLTQFPAKNKKANHTEKVWLAFFMVSSC